MHPSPATLPSPTRNPNPRAPVEADAVARAERLRPLLEANARRCEDGRRIVDENLAALSEAELWSLIVPRRCGGQAVSMEAQLRVAAALARGCGSTAWVQTLVNVSSWAASLLTAPGQRAIFGGSTSARVCGVLSPGGTAVPAPGGYLVNGKWGFASGCLHANWAVLGALFPNGERIEPTQGLVHVPIAELSIEDTWHVAGMRGTGSNTLVATDVFVPHELALGGSFVAGIHDAPPAPSESLDAWPVWSVLTLVLLGPALGIAEAILDAVTRGAHKRGISYTAYGRQIDCTAVLHELARATLEIDTAKLHAFRCAAEIDATGEGREMDLLARARLRGACGYATGVLRSAAERLASIAGASAFAEASPVQRHFRDLHVATRHAFLATLPSLETYGQAIVGGEPTFAFV